MKKLVKIAFFSGFWPFIQNVKSLCIEIANKHLVSQKKKKMEKAQLITLLAQNSLYKQPIK